MNAAWMDKFVRRYEQVDINLVMGTGQGLLTPVLRDVGSRGLKSISNEISSFEDSLFTESGVEISAEKMAVGTFSIHNLGKSMEYNSFFASYFVSRDLCIDSTSLSLIICV